MLSAFKKSATSLYQQRAVVQGGKSQQLVGRRSTSSLAQARRVAEKKNLLVKPDPNAPFFTFPRERLGLNYDLNAVLSIRHRLTPYGEAFRNLYSKHLLMLTKGKLDEYKALVQESQDEKELGVYYVATPELNKKYTPVTASANEVVPDGAFRKLGRELADHIGGSENVFVVDAAIGSHRLGEVNVRVLTNSANVNLYLKHMLVKQGGSRGGGRGDAEKDGKEAGKFAWSLTVYVAPDYELSEDEAKKLGIPAVNKGQGAKEGGKKKTSTEAASPANVSFSISNLDRSITLIGGTNSNLAIKDAIVAAVASRELQNPTFPQLALSTAALFQHPSNPSKSAIVIDPSRILSQLNLKEVKKVEESPSKSESAPTKSSSKSSSKSSQKPASKPSTESLFTAHLQEGVVGVDGALWNHYGAFRMFQGITHSHTNVPRHRGDVVEQVKGTGETRITQSLKDLPSQLPAPPSALVFLIKDSNALLPSLSMLSVDDAIKFFSVGYTGSSNSTTQSASSSSNATSSSLLPFFQSRTVISQPGQIESLVKDLASLHKTQFFVINTQRKNGSSMTSAEIQSLLSAASDGSLASAKSTPNPIFKGFNTITQVPFAFSSSLDISKDWPSQDYSSQAQKLASMFSSL